MKYLITIIIAIIFGNVSAADASAIDMQILRQNYCVDMVAGDISAECALLKLISGEQSEKFYTMASSRINALLALLETNYMTDAAKMLGYTKNVDNILVELVEFSKTNRQYSVNEEIISRLRSRVIK